MGFGSALGKLARNADQLDNIIVRNGVAKVRRRMPTPSLSQLEFEADRAATVTRKTNELDQIKEQRALVREAKGDDAAMARLRQNDPEVDALAEKYQNTKNPTRKIDERLAGRAKKADETLSSTQASAAEFTPDDPRYFRTAQAKKDRIERLAEMQAEGRAPSGEPPLEEHHLIPKGVMAAIVGRADELIAAGRGSRQDVLAMAEYLKEMTGTAGGDRKSDILFMRKSPHNEMHTYMEVGEGMEESKKIWRDKLTDVESMDELFQIWEDWVENQGIYYKQTAEVWEPLEDLLEQITGIPKDSRQKFKKPTK